RQDAAVPERRPALVHHLRDALRQEVVRLVAHDAQEIALPSRKRRVFEQVAEDVERRQLALRRRRRRRGRAAVERGFEAAARAFDAALTILERLLLAPRAAQRQVRVDQVVERQREVEELLDLVLSVQ